MALVFGSITSIEDIIKLYTEDHVAHPADVALSHAMHNVSHTDIVKLYTEDHVAHPADVALSHAMHNVSHSVNTTIADFITTTMEAITDP
ncbi:hypothetical protein B566_EDAN016155 [Ephemera danica]|nr:hypothetical protein B566_EDAN016155 [Ephemera danica]